MATIKDVSKLYNTLKDNNIVTDLPSQEEFAEWFAYDANRQKLHTALRDYGMSDLPDYKGFSEAYGYVVEEPMQQTESAEPLSRRQQKRADKVEAKSNLEQMQESGLIEQAQELKKEYGQQKRQARRQMIGDAMLSGITQGTATGMMSAAGQQIAQQNIEQLIANEDFVDDANEYAQAKLSHTALRDALRAERASERNAFADLAVGIVEGATDLSTWDFGISDMVDMATLATLMEKADNGTLTASEEKILDTYALAQSINNTASNVGGGAHQVGQGLSESLAFMAQMAVNPTSGMAKKLGQRAIRKYGDDVIEMTTRELMESYGKGAVAKKMGAELIGGAGEAAVFAATSGALRSSAEATKKIAGDVIPYVDNNGFVQYGGHTEGEDATEAILKAFGSTFIEGYTEQVGGAIFDPLFSLMRGVSKSATTTTLGELKKGLLDIKGSEWSKGISRMKDALKLDSFASELLEEELGMVMSGVTGIENTLNRYNEDGSVNEAWIFDLNNQLKTAASVALMTGSLKAAEGVGNIFTFRDLNRNLEVAERDGVDAWGSEWESIKNEIDQLGADDLVQYIGNLAADPAVTNERFAVVANYGITLLQWQQYNVASEREQGEIAEIQRNAMTAYNAGRQMHIANFRSVQQRADKAYDALAERDADLLKRADEWLEQQKQTGKLPTTEIETIRNGLSADMSTLLDEYIGAMTARQGIYDNIDDTAYSAMDVFERDLAPVIRDGAVTTATLDGKPVYVLSQENGSAVILSEDAETEHEGKGIMVDASRLKDISTIDAKQLVDAYRYRYATDEQTKADMALNHHRNTQMPTVGMQIDTPSAVEGGATTFIVTNVQPQMGYVELVPGEYDAEQGKVVPKDGAEPIYQTVYTTLQMQDEMYDALDAMNGTQSVPVESEIIEDNEQTEENAPVVTPTEEEVATQEEEVATEETAPAERTQAEIDADDAAELAELGDNDYISSNLDKAKKALDKTKKKKPKATEKEARLAEARTIKAEVDAAQAEVDRWTAASQEVARRALQATQTEQAPISEATGVGENIQSNWAEAEKIEGNTGSKTLQDGTVIKGRYMLVPASAPTASHDALNGYAPSVGFPTNERGQNINDRDYQSDKAAQAESDTPVVSPEGIVYSGNGRTMASQLAAANGTDSAYMEALRSNAAQFGFTPEQVDSIPNARVVFVTDEVLPYTTETFAKFNQQEKKTQSSTERAVSKSKSLKDTSIARILSIIDSYDTLQSFFNSPKACADMLSVLQQDGVITEAEVAGLTELNSNNETVLSATGRDLVADVVLGATFSEQTLRQMGGDKALKQSVLRALPSIIENRQLKEYALNNELEKAISLLYEARKAKMSLEQFLQTTDMFNGSPTDRYSAFEVLLAEKFNNSTEAFRVMMQLYNNSASTLVGGQSELFGEALAKEDIQNLILEKYGKQTNNRGDQAEPVVQSVSGNRQDNETTAAERRAKYGITAKEDARREPLRERAREVAEKLGANINVIEDKSEVTNEDAKKQMRQHKNSIVKGWFENSTGELFIVLPSMDDMADLEATILHELVAHKGLRNLLGARKFNQLCDAVWEMMTPEQQQEWLAYPGVNGNKRAAADEYIASLAEKMDLSEVEQTTWSKIKQFVLDVLQKLGFRDITENDIQDLIRASYAYMRAGNTNEQTTNEGNRYKVYRSRDGKEVGYTQLSQLSLQFDWSERERDTVSGRNTDVLQREDDATLATLNTLRGLEEGEVCNVERIFTESKGFDFTSGEKIESAADVAYIFKNLEDEAIENVFVALVKDGKPTVIHVGMGGQAYSLVDNSAVVAAANRINPDKVYLVHNHPSGVLRCSPQDRSMLKSVKDALGDVVQDGIIINTRSGKFGVFSESMFGTDGTSDMPENKEDTPLKVYKFNKQAFKSNVITIEASSNGIAEFISTQRLGSRNKINALLLNSQLGCVGNVFLTETEVNDTNRDSIAQRLVDDAVAMNARNIVIYGNYPLVSVAVESNIQLRDAIEKASGKTVELKDVIEINGSAFPPSALNYGVRFRATIAPEVRKEMESIKADAIANGTFLKAPNGKDTNLNEEQWLMVRTSNFKKWFGDWMKAARIEKLRKSQAIDVDYNNEYELNRESAKSWMKDNLRGEYTNADTGEKIQVSKVGINEVTSHGSKDMAHLKSLVAIPSFIKGSIFIDEVENAKDNDRYDSYRYYVCGAKIDGEDYTVKVVIGVKGDRKYYDHRLTQIEKGTLIDNLNGLSNSVAENQNANNSIGKDSKLISILQTNSSKVVDENGEPMVVYHGTESEFTSFEMQDGSIGRGAYFTSNWDEAAQYAMEKQGVENIDELDESKIKEVFLNVRDEKNITHSRFSRDDIEILATSPNQIKSATDNNGEFSESNDIRFRTLEERKALRDSEESKIIFDTAKEKFGTTYDLREAGYILPDGTMLDFSGRHEIRGADTSFLAGDRTVDHRAIQEIEYDFDENETGVKTDMGDFLDRGAVRIDVGAGAINLNIPPTSKQKDILRRLIERNDGYVYVDFGNGWDTEHYAEYEDTTSRRILNDIDRYYSEDIKPAGDIRFRVVTDKATLDRLNSEPTIKVYRAMQLIDGKLYPPMSAVVDGKLREPSEIGVWEEAEENPELADEKGYFKLNKGNKKSVSARYNPYFHTSRTPLNDQFASAQDRPELVTVEVEVPESELTSGYKAEKAKDSVGAMQWKAGVVQSKLSGKREVILSRWAKPIRIVPDSEVADEIVKMFDGKDITMPSNVVTPSLRAELEKRGVPFVETDNQGKEVEDRTMFSVKQRTEADYQDIENRLGIAAAEYERRMDMASVHHMEAWQDSMRSLLEMQRAIEKETGKPILDYENAYMAENRMSSENFAQMEEWKRKFFRPLEDIYKGFIDRGENQFSIRDYLFAKHGMERNAVMARREAQRLYPNDPLQQIAKESDLKRTKDYSGLKKLMGKDNIPEAIAEAQKYVQDFEKKHKAEIVKLWDAIRNATHSQLEVQRASGLLSQEKYEEIKNMYNYYVPLRGFSETTTDEVYDYIDNSPTPYNVPIKTAKGRESVGDDPIANIANMTDSGIMQANRNKMKLHFLNMAERHKTNLVTVSEVIYKYNPVAKMWEPTLPALSPNDTIEETLAKIQQHKNKIAQEMILNPQDYKTEANLKKMGKDIPYKVINKAMLSEHQVLVMREGKQMVMTINGNPRAAQALNGLTNPEVKAEEQRWIQKANRFMAANFTSRNPAFVISNLSRDSIYAVSMVWAKEAPKYARAFMNNMGKVFANMASLMHKYNNGTLDTNVPMEKMFLEFVMNGGQTGYTHLQSVEDYKRQMAKEMKRAAQHKGVRAVTETGRAILNGLENMNKWAENISRFTAYVTSREDGRSISRSISDAKEISVNFNKKGAGNSVAGKFEKGNRLNYLSSQTAQLARGLYIFMNAGIQGMANFAKQAKRHPYKITAMIASSMALGLAAALLSGGGDDEEEYLSLPKYTRRNNLCIKVGDKFVTIPLPIELRAFYGIGELIASRTALGEYYSDAEFAKEFAEQLSQSLPIDVLEGGEGFNIKSFIPSAAKPIVDVILNESWTGIPIYNDSEFVKTYPGWKKAYKGTNDMLVDVSRWLNEHSGGSDYRQGVIDINPAAIEYIAEQYLGGVGTTVNQFLKMGQTATGAMEFEWRNVPVASRFVNSGNETTQIRAIRNSYYDYREEMDAVGKEFNAYMRDLKKPDLPEEEYQRIEQEIDRIVNSPEYDFYLWWKDINKVINRAKDAGDAEGADELMREAVETYRSWKKGLE